MKTTCTSNGDDNLNVLQYRVVSSASGTVRVDIQKAQEAMRRAMEVREKIRARDTERDSLKHSYVVTKQ